MLEKKNFEETKRDLLSLYSSVVVKEKNVNKNRKKENEKNKSWQHRVFFHTTITISGSTLSYTTDLWCVSLAIKLRILLIQLTIIF